MADQAHNFIKVTTKFNENRKWSRYDAHQVYSLNSRHFEAMQPMLSITT